jgi:hypothetical protein
MSAALKQKPLTPTPFQSAERARLGHAIARAASVDAQKAALAKAVATADDEVRAARRAVEAADEAIETAKSNAARHLTDVARGTAGVPPQTIREARAAAIEAADHLESCLSAAEALRTEAAGDNDLSGLLLRDAAHAVVRSEAAGRAVALAAKVLEIQRKLVEVGSGLQWLANAGALPRPDSGVANTLQRLEATNSWAVGPIKYSISFAEPIGSRAWQAAFERLQTDANAELPD